MAVTRKVEAFAEEVMAAIPETQTATHWASGQPGVTVQFEDDITEEQADALLAAAGFTWSHE